MDQFEMIVTDIEEHEDGSATVTFDLPGGAVRALMQYAILDILKKAVAADKETK